MNYQMAHKVIICSVSYVNINVNMCDVAFMLSITPYPSGSINRALNKQEFCHHINPEQFSFHPTTNIPRIEH